MSDYRIEEPWVDEDAPEDEPSYADLIASGDAVPVKMLPDGRAVMTHWLAARPYSEWPPIEQIEVRFMERIAA